MELCLGIFGGFYLVLHHILGLALLMAILPMMAAKITIKLKLNSINLLVIFVGTLAYMAWFIFTNENYLFFYTDHLPRLTCGYVL